jgi:hypothetical protein
MEVKVKVEVEVEAYLEVDQIRSQILLGEEGIYNI